MKKKLFIILNLITTPLLAKIPQKPIEVVLYKDMAKYYENDGPFGYRSSAYVFGSEVKAFNNTMATRLNMTLPYKDTAENEIQTPLTALPNTEKNKMIQKKTGPYFTDLTNPKQQEAPQAE